MKEYDVTEQEFEYSGVEGVAELLGWQIVFFRRKDDLLNTAAIWFFEILDNEIKNTANIILKRLGIDLVFGKEIEIEDNLGKADFVDDILEETIRYGYVLSSSQYISIGLTNGKLSHLEIVNDENIIEKIVSVRN